MICIILFPLELPDICMTMSQFSSFLHLKTGSRFFLGILLVATVFIIDLYTPLGIADGMSYVVIVLLTIWSEDKRHTMILGIASILLVVAGYFVSPVRGDIHDIAMLNRCLSIICIITAISIIKKYKNVEAQVEIQRERLMEMTKELKRSNDDLEGQVKVRTMVLEDALHELERSKNELHSALERERELSALKTRIVSMASHEFRTPLATILSSINLISAYAETNDKEKQLRHISRIKSSISHLTDLIEDTLSVSKLDEGKIAFNEELIPIEKFISDFIQEVSPLKKPGQVIRYSHEGAPGFINDRKIIKRIIMNLTSNAIKFSDENSEIIISTECNNGNFVLKVKDNGIGIPTRDKSHLFERFFRAENAVNIQGTGLGLCIVAKYVEFLKGSIEVASELNKGSLFTIKIPAITP